MAEDVNSLRGFLRMETFMLLHKDGNATDGKDNGQQ